MDIKTVTKEEVLELENGYELNGLVRQVIDSGEYPNSAYEGNYSADSTDFHMLLEILKSEGEFYSFHMTADGFNVEYGYGRGVVQAEDMLVGLCKAVVLNHIENVIVK